MKARILIVEDHPLVSEATKGLLLTYDCSNSITIVGSAAEALSALRLDAEWDLVLLDLDVPGAHGLSLAKELSTLGLAKKTCVVTALSRKGLIEEARALGLLGFIPKASPLPIFSESLRCVLNGLPVFPETVGPTRAAPRLTRQQLRVLELMAQGLSSKQMARVLLITEGTVNNHVNATLHALGAANRLQAFRKALEYGLIDAEVAECDGGPSASCSPDPGTV